MGQVVIAITGALAILLTQVGGEHWSRYACLIGLIGQPFWLAATWRAKQWGMWALSGFYTGAWIAGVYVFWIKAWVAA